MKPGALIVICALCAVAGAEPVDFVRYVRTEMGTSNAITDNGRACRLSNGNLYPLAIRPWGNGGWAPQTRVDGQGRWFYDYKDERICGIRQTRQPSPWIGDYGAWNFLPVTGRASEDAKDRASWFSHRNETCGPDLYRVYLSDYDVEVSVTPLPHGGLARVIYPETATPGLVVNPLPGGCVSVSEDGLAVRGQSVWNNNHRYFGAAVTNRFVIRLPRPAIASSTLTDGALHLVFAPTARGEALELRLASSFISAEQAEVNLRESDGLSFADAAAAARAEWNDRLGRIRAVSDDEEKLQTFYTCFFRTMIFPMSLWERTAERKSVHWSPATGETLPGRYYAGTGFWDTFRALFPLLNLLAPEVNAQMMEGLANCCKEYGWLPEWSAPGLSDCMIGNNSASVVADAWLSGVRGDFDIEVIWAALVRGANGIHPQVGAVGRRGFAAYNAKGYVPRGCGVREPAACTLEYAYDDWCIAQLGRALGKPESVVGVYEQRAGNWRNVFDPVRRIAVGRNADGTFNADFSPFAWGGDFTEGSAIHYTWSVFHDVQGLMAAMGGKAEFERRIDEIFTLPPTADCSAYGTLTHEAREMQVMDMGQYAHGNQPIQHLVYLYDWCGAWRKAQKRAREAMERLYRPTPDGYCGDEDNGQTSAWYVWRALGLYPVCPGSGEYSLGAPLFDSLEVNLPSGAVLRISAPRAASRQVFTSTRFGDKRLSRPFVRRVDLMSGGELVFGIDR